MTTLFLSDTHLTGQRPQVTEMLFDCLKAFQPRPRQLYILGDFFEAWLGDDAILPDQRPVLEWLRALTDSGVRVFVMHGNRDFLLGAEFARLTGVELIAENTIVDLYGAKVLLAHGDALCTDDIEYQAFRSMVRNERWQQQALSLPVAKRIEMAQQYRNMSKSQTGLKPADIMDVNPDAVVDVMRRYQVQYLIHGHTHRPAIHAQTVNDNPGARIVLGDWLDAPSVLECRADTWYLRDTRVPNGIFVPIAASEFHDDNAK